MLKRFFSFKEFATPKVMGPIFWAMMAVLGLICLLSLAMGIRNGSWDNILSPIIVMFVGTIFIRVSCDVVLVLFRIHDALRDIRASLHAAQNAGDAPKGTAARVADRR